MVRLSGRRIHIFIMLTVVLKAWSYVSITKSES
jgi:hypothetical protein